MKLRAKTEPPPREALMVVAVDRALHAATSRSVFTPIEALALLRGVRDTVTEGEASGTVSRIVAEAESSFADCMVLDRTRVVDPLLDMRLALCT